MAGKFPDTRMRRMRKDDFSRRLARENSVSVDDLIYPVFVLEEDGAEQDVPSMPGIKRQGLDHLLKTAERCHQLGIPALALFPVIGDDKKSLEAEEAFNPDYHHSPKLNKTTMQDSELDRTRLA